MEQLRCQTDIVVNPSSRVPVSPCLVPKVVQFIFTGGLDVWKLLILLGEWLPFAHLAGIELECWFTDRWELSFPGAGIY
jgi:hypothetical protein